MTSATAERLPRQRRMPGNQLGFQPDGRESHGAHSSVSPLPVPQAGSPIPVRCASPMATPEVSGVLGNDGECATLSQLSALSSSLEQLISVMRTLSVSQTGMSGGMENSAAGVWSAVLADPRSIPQTSVVISQDAGSSSVVNVPDKGAKGAKECMPCFLSPLGFHLPSSLKERIWKGDYIDLNMVIPLSREFSKYERRDEKTENETIN